MFEKRYAALFQCAALNRIQLNHVVRCLLLFRKTLFLTHQKTKINYYWKNAIIPRINGL